MKRNVQSCKTQCQSYRTSGKYNTQQGIMSLKLYLDSGPCRVPVGGNTLSPSKVSQSLRKVPALAMWC